MTSTRTEKSSAKSSSRPPAAPAVHDARVRVRILHAEADATDERTAKAALLYEAGYLHEMMLHQPALAVQDYLGSYNADNRSRLPLHALIRMFERRRSYKNLARLYEAELRTALSAHERSNALTDQATLSIFSGHEPAAAQALLERALEQDSLAEAALLLEWSRLASGDRDGALRALEKRAESCDDPALRGALLLELAGQREPQGDIPGALAALRAAALGPGPVQDVYTSALARFARQHDFPEELVEACERRATRMSSELRELQGERTADPQLLEALRARAIAHWYEAARLRCTTLGDPLGALRSIESAVGLCPDDPLFRQLRMLAYDLLEDRGRAAGEARALLDAGLAGEQAAALHFRLAEQALVEGDSETARQKLVEAIAVAGGSLSAEAILDDLLLDQGEHEERIAQRETLASHDRGASALVSLGEAAQIAAHDLRDRERAARLYTRADALFGRDAVLLREAYGSALDLDDQELATFALDRLLALELAPDERAAVLLHRLELAEDSERATLIDAELAHPERPFPWLKLATMEAAAQRDYPRLSQLHEASALRESDGDEAASELCAAARAALRAHDLPRARWLLEQALSRAPAQRYALTLLEEVLREQGDAAAAITLLRSAAARHEGARAAELSLLSAGAAAEMAGKFDKAAQNYLEAASRPEPSLGALWALYRLAQRRRDRELERKARTHLVERERAEGRASVDTLLLAEHYDLSLQQPGLAEPLLHQALADEDGGHHAAIALLLSRTAGLELRSQALELLSTRATDSLRPALLRELGGTLISHGHPSPRVLDLAERVLRSRADDRWALWTRTHTTLPHDEEGHAAALEAFAQVTTDPHIADAARAEALWALQLATPLRPLEDTLATLGLDADAQGPEVAATVVALASPAHDGALRLQALDRVARSAEPEGRATALLALARARLARDDAEGALNTVEELLARDGDELATWELAHVAAQRAKRPSLRARAAEMLAEHLDGEAALELLEESASVRLDELGDAEGAEQLLMRVLAMSPRRVHAYRRLHELIERRGDTPKLIALIKQRARLTDDAEELVKLFSELAGLERKRGSLDAALDAIDKVLMFDDENLQALALSAEIHTSRGSFREAVDALDRLRNVDALPNAQRRIAGLGAADFLEHKLDDRQGALERLEALLELEPDDATLHVRVADVAERLDAFERAESALARALALGSAGDRVALTMRRGRLLEQKLARPAEAAIAYRRALELAPGNVDAARLLFGIERDDALLPALESELRSEARERPRDPAPLRKLYQLSTLHGDSDLAFIALSGLAALRALDEHEQRAWEQLSATARRVPARDARLSEQELRGLLAPALDARADQLVRTVFSAAAELDLLEPGRFGVGRSQRVSAKESHPVRDQLRALSGCLGLTLGDVYVGGPEPRRVAVLPRQDELAMVIGAAIVAPLSGEARHAVARELAAASLDALPLLTRTPAEAARLVYAALLAEGCPLPPRVDRAALAELAKTVGRALPRRVKRLLPELSRALPAGDADLEAHCRAALVRTRRLALLFSGELALALGSPALSQDEALDLLRTWTSSAMSVTRRKLGLAL
jgi:lipopolysaccharide biosynthesis regulator YciM